MTTANMKRTISIAAALLPLLSASAQTGAADSIHAQELHEIVFEAPKVIRKADMDVYHPSQSAVDASKNGLQLLGNLMIPALSVSEALGTIQAAGQAVQRRHHHAVRQIRPRQQIVKPMELQRAAHASRPAYALHHRCLQSSVGPTETPRSETRRR